MLAELLEKKLEELKNEDILVVMDDGLAFLGELDDFDRKTLVLKDVYQAPAKSIDWKELDYKSDEVREHMEDEKKVGFIDWTKINLEEVYIRVAHTSRIWRWKRKKEEKKSKKSIREPKRPIYSKGDEIPDERGASIGDISDTFRG